MVSRPLQDSKACFFLVVESLLGLLAWVAKAACVVSALVGFVLCTLEVLQGLAAFPRAPVGFKETPGLVNDWVYVALFGAAGILGAVWWVLSRATGWVKSTERKLHVKW